MLAETLNHQLLNPQHPMIKALTPEEQGAAEGVTLETIAAGCKKLRASCDAAEKVVNEYEAEKLALEKRFSPRLIAAADRIKTDLGIVITDLAAAKPLFRERKTETFFGFRVGWMKQPGKVEFADEADTIARIEKLLAPKESAGLIKVTKKLVKKALSALPGDVLKKIGVTVGADSEAPFLKVVEGDAMKRLNALLQQEEEAAG
jgi:hypothetical protein